VIPQPITAAEENFSGGTLSVNVNKETNNKTLEVILEILKRTKDAVKLYVKEEQTSKKLKLPSGEESYHYGY
jgi:hypothetical protein